MTDPRWIKWTSSAGYRSSTPAGNWNIPLSPGDLHAIGKGYADSQGIPTRYNRKYEDAAIEGEILAISKAARPSKRPLAVGDLVYFRPSENRGTKKYPDVIYPVCFGRIEVINPKTYTVRRILRDGTLYGEWRVNHEYVIGRVTKKG
jgi:hypothetical protein